MLWGTFRVRLCPLKELYFRSWALGERGSVVLAVADLGMLYCTGVAGAVAWRAEEERARRDFSRARRVEATVLGGR